MIKKKNIGFKLGQAAQAGLIYLMLLFIYISIVVGYGIKDFRYMGF